MSDESVSNAAPAGVKLRHTLRGHNDVITRLAWAPDGSTLVSASKDGTVRLWDPETGALRRVFDSDSASVYSVTWSPDGRLLASASQDGLRIWSIETGELYGTGNWSRLVWGIAWSPDGQILATGDSYNVQFWDTKTWKQRSSRLHSMAVSSGAVVVGSGALDVDIGVAAGSGGVAVGGDVFGHVIVGGTITTTIGTLHPRLRPRPFTTLLKENSPSSLEWSPEGTQLAATFAHFTIRIYDSETLELHKEFNEPSSQALGVAWSPGGPKYSPQRFSMGLCDSGTLRPKHKHVSLKAIWTQLHLSLSLMTANYWPLNRSMIQSDFGISVVHRWRN